MKIAVIYNSKWGHTRKIAEAIAQICDVEAIDITKPHTLEEVDLLFVGTGISKGQPYPLMMDYLDQLAVKKVRTAAIFSTSVTGEDQTELLVNLLRHKGVAMCREHYVCKTGHFLFTHKQPGEEELERVKRYAMKVINAFHVEKE